MKQSAIYILIALSLSAARVPAETVVAEVPDTLPGKGFGGLSGFMAGAVAGGPVGVAIGTGVGWLLGGATQEVAGLSGTAYRVRAEDGVETVVRSPNRSWKPGDRVQVIGERLVAEDGGLAMQPSLGLAEPL